MLTALDSSVILDVLTGDPVHGLRSEAAVRRAAEEGGLVIGEYALAELMAAWAEEPARHARDFLDEWQIEYIPASRDCVLRAGELFRRCLDRDGPSASNLIPDLLVASHAHFHADRLLIRRSEDWNPNLDELEVMRP